MKSIFIVVFVILYSNLLIGQQDSVSIRQQDSLSISQQDSGSVTLRGNLLIPLGDFASTNGGLAETGYGFGLEIHG